MTSFSANVKSELCRAEIKRVCCAQAECYGALLLGNTFRAGELRILTSHDAYAERLPDLFECAFGFRADIPLPLGKGLKRLFSVSEPDKVAKVRSVYGYGGEDDVALHLNNAVLENECCHSAFWRGAFLSGGTVTDPQKKYLLEIVTPHRVLARELLALLRECSIEGAVVTRSSVQVLSIKASECIEDFLTLTGASLGAMAIMEAKVEKDMRNRVNRRVNCDTANVDKTLAAAERLRDVIIRLADAGRLDGLPQPLKDTADVRIAHPEDSLSQLAERLGITKSCLNHRLRKLAQLAEGDKP